MKRWGTEKWGGPGAVGREGGAQIQLVRHAKDLRRLLVGDGPVLAVHGPELQPQLQVVQVLCAFKIQNKCNKRVGNGARVGT